MSRWDAGRERSVERYCANCGEWRAIYITHRDPRRSICQTCYMDLGVRRRFGKDYRYPSSCPPHRNVEMWFTQPWGRSWLETHPRFEYLPKLDKGYAEYVRTQEWREVGYRDSVSRTKSNVFRQESEDVNPT